MLLIDLKNSLLITWYRYSYLHNETKSFFSH